MTGDVAVVELLRHPLVHVTLVILFVIVVLVELLVMLPSESAEKFPAKTRLDALHRVAERHNGTFSAELLDRSKVHIV